MHLQLYACKSLIDMYGGKLVKVIEGQLSFKDLCYQ